MKSKKWIWVTLTVLLTLVVLAGVAGASFRMGAMQGTNLTRNADRLPANHPPVGPMQSFGNDFNDQRGGDPHMMQGFGYRGLERGRGGIFSPLFGLVHLILLGVLIWFGFRLIKNSGWRLTRVPQHSAPSETPAVEEKKE